MTANGWNETDWHDFDRLGLCLSETPTVCRTDASLPLEGRAFADTPTYYERLPSTVTTNVNATARALAKDSAGLQFRFVTDSDTLVCRWTLVKGIYAGDNLSGVDASCYVLDCIANMREPDVRERLEPFVRKLRALKPETPIVVAERTVNNPWGDGRNVIVREIFEKLTGEGVRGLYRVPAEGLMPSDWEGTVEGGHPNDLGMVSIARAFASVVRKALSTPADAFRRQCPDGPASPGDLGMDFPDVVLCRTEPVNLPELLKTADGRTVTTKAEWEQVRRPEILRFFTEEMFGIRPVERPEDLAFEELSPDKVMLGGKALRKRRIVSFSGPRGKFRFSFTAFIPTGKGKPAASFINICCPGRNDNIDPDLTLPNGYWPVRDIIARGYAAIAFQPEELAWDEYHPRYEDGRFRAIDPDFTNDVYACFAGRRTDRSWGMISVWAWGASRILDWIETEPLLDAKRVAVVGHSRCGKTALWCGATDTRVALVCANNSGCCGAKLNRLGALHGLRGPAPAIRTFRSCRPERWSRLDLQKVLAECDGDGLGAIGGADLAEDRRDVLAGDGR